MARARHRIGAIFVLAACAVANPWGCRTATQITVTVTTDLDCKTARGAVIAVGRVGEIEAKDPISASTACIGDRFGSVVLVPSGSKSDEIAFKLVAGVTSDAKACAKDPSVKGCVVARRALRFIPHEDLRVDVALRGDCVDVECDPKSTCVHGNCRPATIDDPSLCVGAVCDDTQLPSGPVWAKGFPSSVVDPTTLPAKGNAITIASDHSVTIAGGTASDVDFGGTVFVGSVTRAVSAKFDGAGKHVWSKSYPADFSDIWAAALDPNGDVLFAADFQGTIDVGGGPTGSTSGDVLLFRLAPDGAHRGSAKFGLADKQGVSAIVVDGSRNVYCSGEFVGSMELGGTTKALASKGLNDAWIAKLGPDLQGIWSVAVGGTDDEHAQALALDSTGNLFVGGEFSGDGDFGGTTLTAKDQTDFYVMKIGPSGAPIWARAVAGAKNDRVFSLAATPAGSVLVGGATEADFFDDRGQVKSRGFFMAFDKDGTATPVTTFGDGSGAGVVYVGVHPSGDTILAGYFGASITLGGKTVTSAGDWDVFVARLAPTGEARFLRRYGGTGIDWLGAAALERDGTAIALTGAYTGAPDYGSGPIANAAALSMFVARIPL